MEENNYKKHLEKELEIIRSSHKEGTELTIEPYLPTINKIIDVFSMQGHSGCSASCTSGYLSKVIKNILSFKPLSPITCTDEEWTEISENEYQNKRLSSVFKEGNGKPYYLDAIVWKGEERYDTFTGKVEDVHSRQFIKLPFTPKTFYIDVVKVFLTKEEIKDEDYYEDGDKYYTYKIKDKNQLKEVFKYYEKK